MIFNESNLVFSFPDDWQVIKLDEHRYYKALSGRGFKGVDFLGIADDNVYLIEVKNYASRLKNDKHQPVDFIQNHQEHFIQTIIQKWSDTLKIIDGVERYYNRKWYIKLLNSLSRLTSKPVFEYPFFGNADFAFWKRVFARTQPNYKKLHLVLWLELGDQLSTSEQSQLNTVLSTKLKRNTAFDYADIHLLNKTRNTLNIAVNLSH